MPDIDSPDSLPGSAGAISRRALLKGLGVGGAAVAVAGTGLLSYRVFDAAVLDPDHGAAFDAWRTWRSTPGALGTVAAAILAASPHNSQPWLFAVRPSAVDVYADPTRRLGTLDPAGREMRVGLGCAVENLAIAARARGLAPTVTLLPDGPDRTRVAHVELPAGATARSPLYDAIGRRHTNRGPYDNTPIAEPVLADLVDTSGLPGVDIHWVTRTDDVNALGTVMVDAAQAVTDDEQQSRDSFVWFRASDDAVQRHRDGITHDGQGLSPPMLTIAKLLPASSRAAGDEFWVSQTRDVHTRTATAYGVLTVRDAFDAHAQLVGGRLLQRVHLTATQKGVALHHMNQITERIDRELTTGAPATFAERFAEFLPAGTQPLVAFRVGYPLRAARPAPRRRLPEVTR